MSECFTIKYDPYTLRPEFNSDRSVFKHPKYKQFEEYLKMKKYQKERRKFQMEELSTSKNIEEHQRTLFGKIKNKFVDLFHV
jgi:hypothetical protein